MPFFHLLKIRPKGKTELKSRTEETGFGNDSARSLVRACCRIREAFLLKASIRGLFVGVERRYTVVVGVGWCVCSQRLIFFTIL